MTEGVVNVTTNNINDVQPTNMVIMSTISNPNICSSSSTTTYKYVTNTFATSIQPHPKIIHNNNHNNITYVVRTTPPTSYIINGRIQAPPNGGLQLFRPTAPVVLQSRPGPVIIRSPKPIIQRPPVIRVIQPVGPSHSNPQIKTYSPIKTSTPKPVNPPVSRKEVTPPMEYPGNPKEVFDCTFEKSARCLSVNWKKFREEYNSAEKVNEKQRILKPWDPHYQPLVVKQRAARSFVPKPSDTTIRQATSLSLNSMVNGGPLVEKNNFLIDFKRKYKRKRLNDSMSSHKTTESVLNIKQEFENGENFDYSTSKYTDFDHLEESPKKKIKTLEKIYKPRTKKGEYLLTLGKRGYNNEDWIYLNIAANSMLEKAHKDMDDLDSSLKSIMSVENLFNDIEPDSSFEPTDIVDHKTKKLSFKKSISYSIKKVIVDLPVGKKYKKPKIRDDGTHEYFDDYEIKDVIPNPSGCARTEPYKKKREYIPNLNGDNTGKQYIIITEEDEKEVKAAIERNKQERQIQRHMLTILQNEAPDLAKLDIFKANSIINAAKLVKHAKSPIHGSGLFALEDIEPDQMIIEYVGEKIRHLVADLREKKYEEQGIGGSYMFRLDDNWVIDATKKGNLARFINHCCQPNCYARIVSRGGIKRIFIFSRYFIEKGEEITYNYNFEYEDATKKIRCYCGAKQCRNYLN